MLRIRKKQINKIAIYGYLLLVLYTSGSVYDYRYGVYSDFIKIALSIYGVALFVFLSKTKHIDQHHIIKIMIILIGLLVCGIINGSNMMSIFGLEIRLLGMFFFVEFCLNTEITSNIERVSLKRSSKEWAEIILQYSNGYPRNNMRVQIAQAGWDVSSAMKRFFSLYSVL